MKTSDSFYIVVSIWWRSKRPNGLTLVMVSEENRPYITPHSGEVDLRDAIQALAADAKLRAAIGKANRAKAIAEYDDKAMIAAYAHLYEQALGRPGVLS